MGQEQLLLALDFGGTKLTAAAVSTSELAVSGERGWRAHRMVPSPPASNAQSDLGIMMGLARDLLASPPRRSFELSELETLNPKLQTSHSNHQ